MLLDRDDRGGANDFILVNGRKVLSPIRQETVSIRGNRRRRIHCQRLPLHRDGPRTRAGFREG